MTRAGRVVCCALACGALFAFPLPLPAQTNAPKLVHIDRVQLAPAQDAAPPPPGAPAWRSVQLPWDWQPRGDGTPVWCLAEFALAEMPDRPLQMLVVQAGYGAEVFLNGHSIAVQGLPPAALWGRREPVSVSLPVSLLKVGSNALALRIQVRPEFAGYLTPIWVGEPEAIHGRLSVALAFFALPDFLALFALALGAVHWFVYRGERRREWLWLACAFLMLGVAGQRWRALDFLVWSLGIAASTSCVVCAMHRVAGLSRRSLEAGFGVSIALLAVLALGLPAWRYTLTLAAATYSGVLTCYLLLHYRRPAVSAWLTRPGLLTGSVVLALLLPMNDLPMYWNRAPWIGVPLLPVTHTFVLFNSALQLVLFLSTRLTQARSLNRELAESQERVVALEREQATRSERVRFQRELHDGLGAQLVSALAVAEREPSDGPVLRDALRGALGELRVAVDSLDGEERELVEVLGSLRARLEPLVQGTGIEFSWRVGDVASARRIPPDHAIHLLRVLQEAIANAVKHAAPGRIEVRSGDASPAGAPMPFVEVQDDGTGFVAPSFGRGLENMRRRAELIGGSLEITSAEGGTRVRLLLP